MFLKEYSLQTPSQAFVNVTQKVKQAIRESGITDGTCIVYTPHTTSGITINENADPDVVRDLLFALDKTFPDLSLIHIWTA